jgi:hypothetical protein
MPGCHDLFAMMRHMFQNTAFRPYAACAAAGILTVGLITAPPVTSTALARTEVHAIQLAAITAPAAPTSAVRPAAASPTADDTTSTAPPDFLAYAAEVLAYLNSLGLGAGPGLAAIGLSGFVVAFAATAYAWNSFANTVNPGLRFFGIPRVPKFPVCFAGQVCASSTSAATRPMTAASAAAKPADRGVATSKRAATTAAPTAAKVRGTTKSTASSASSAGKAGSKRGRS